MRHKCAHVTSFVISAIILMTKNLHNKWISLKTQWAQQPMTKSSVFLWEMMWKKIFILWHMEEFVTLDAECPLTHKSLMDFASTFQSHSQLLILHYHIIKNSMNVYQYTYYTTKYGVIGCNLSIITCHQMCHK